MRERRRVRDAAPELIDAARDLRRRQTPAESRFWEAVRSRQGLGYRVRRQHPIGGYVLDFWIPAHHIGIEIDGPIHQNDDVATSDAERAAWLNAQGITVLRFTNEEIFDNLEKIFNAIEAEIRSRR
jgi:very-short-patch-repair endonuclease